MIDFEKWKRETCKLSDMRPYGNNPRFLTKKGMKELRASLEGIGYVDEIALFKDGRIAGGHGRYYVCSADGVEEVPIKRCAVDLSPEEEREVVVRLNKNIAGVWDFDILGNHFELDELVIQGFSLDELKIAKPLEPEDFETENGNIDSSSFIVLVRKELSRIKKEAQQDGLNEIDAGIKAESLIVEHLRILEWVQ